MMEENPSPKKSTEIDLLLAEIPVSQRPTDPLVIRQLLNSITVMVPAPSPTVTVGSEFFETSKTAAEDPNESDLPIGSKIGRYSITSRLGFGGFGSVYLAHDTELGRLVAIKIPHLKRVRNDVDRLMYLMEARTLAQLDHQGIVPVYDFGVMSDGRCFVVSKYIAGQDLSHVLHRESLVISRSVEILIAVADALHYVHETRMVHRDIKPGNLLVGDDGRIYVADFGLALRESRQPSELSTAGTPSYMSPEQVRGEGHRVDGRSDQFSLGCVMYEILTGVRAFTGHSTQEILHRVVSREPDPPREINRKIPRELNRICLKLLSKLAMDRYAATSELADDLRHWLETNATVDSPDSAPVRTAAKQSTLEFTQTLSQSVVVPRGLHAFTMDDAGFFITLLPGIRDRNGLPPSLSHWKRWIDSSEMVPEMHRVGVISGPTGCGKSSLVRAGLFPLLSDDIVTVIVDASPDATERQLVQEIERQCHERIADSLTDWIAAIRRGRGLPKNKTLLIVIDQFEQWLHAHPSPLDTELVRSMRQCDGSRVQCLILVRDDFWLALSRFMDAVESPLILRNNALMVDLFREDHARKVLIEFGRGYGRLPEDGVSLSDDQNRFVDEVLSNLSANGNIVPVHLALFTEMVKNRDWVPATLRQIGGAIGVGSTFLSESFSGSNASENHRLHENAARKVLRALLPSAGTEIKGGRRSRADLVSLSGYGGQPSQFNRLIEILENELKLVSAAVPLNDSQPESDEKNADLAAFQLSHDFLVPAIREWIAAKQRQTYRGRLHQRITERAALWGPRRDSRLMPGFPDWLQARIFLRPGDLSDLERQMLAARDFHSVFSIVAGLTLILVLTFGWREHQARLRVSGLVDQLRTASFQMAPALIEQLSSDRRLAEPLLKVAIADAADGSTGQFLLRVAELPWNPAGYESIYHHVIDRAAENDSVENTAIAATALKPFAKELSSRNWEMIESPDERTPHWQHRQFCAAQLLASIDSPGMPSVDARWEKSADVIAWQLVDACSKRLHHFDRLERSMRPVSKFLVPHLTPYLVPRLMKMFREKAEDVHAGVAVPLLASYTNNDIDARTSFYLVATDSQKEILIKSADELSQNVLWDVVRGNPKIDGIELNGTEQDRRRGLAAALLLARPDTRNSDELWHLLGFSPDPTMRTVLIHDLRATRVPVAKIAIRLQRERDSGIVRSLLQALGEYGADDPDVTGPLRDSITKLFRDDPDSGVHSSSEWLLRRWGDIDTIKRIQKAGSSDHPVGELAGTQWMTTTEGHTLVLIDGKKELAIGRRFLMSTKEVTIGQLLKYDPGKYVNREYGPTDDCPANVVLWKTAHLYCNWLSRAEGLEAVYPVDGEVGSSWLPDFEHLARPGYRLPTAAEWEFACRAGTTTVASIGNDKSYAGKFAWLESDSWNSAKQIWVSSPVGRLKPNDWGLFDMNGNAAEWCDDFAVGMKRPLLGTNSQSGNDNLDSGYRVEYQPDIDFNRNGFRIVRTVNID